MVDAVDTLFRNEPGEARIEPHRAVLVETERLLQGELGAAGKFQLSKRIADQLGHGRRQREVDGRRALTQGEQPLQLLGPGHIGPAVHRRGHEVVDAGAGRLGGGEGLHDDRPPFGGRELVAARTDQAQPAYVLLGQELPQRRQEQPGSEVSACAEDE